MSDDSEAIRHRAIHLGYLSGDEAAAAQAEYRQSGGDAGFASFLLEIGAVNLSQMADLQGEADMGATMIGDMVADPIVGKEFSGCFVERKLGQGGMGAVYLARRADGEEVVIKFLAAEQATNPTWRGRFIREAEVMQSIDHPNVVSVYGIDGDCSQPHIVMEFVDGAALDARLEEEECIEPLEACRIAHDAALGLAEAHKAGIVHRDIKPANIILTRDGQVRVLDFGLAKNVQVDDGLSLPGQVLGTPHYMAPEQWGDHAVDARCDVFSLGATLYHLVTGVVPFPGKTPNAISAKILKGEFPRPKTFVPDVPEDLELVIYRMMAVHRGYRYPSATRAAEDLARVLEGDYVEVPRLVDDAKQNRYPLLPGTSFTVGRDEACEVVVKDRSVSRQHARIERGKTGFVLNDLGSTYGSFVGGMRIRNVVLKDGDAIKFGKVSLLYRDGGLSESVLTTKRLAPDLMRVETLPVPFVKALIEDADKRVVQALLEDLAPDAIESRATLAGTRMALRCGKETADRILAKLRGRLRRVSMRIPHYLFTITHENLGDDAEGWLGWWDQNRGSYPPQIATQESLVPARLNILGGEPEPRAIPLENEGMFTVGRDEKSSVMLLSRSVSRLHATIFRFHNRLVIRDEGSRFGTIVNGSRVRIAFLQPGDMLTMGKVEMTFETDTPDPSATMAESDAAYIDSEAWFLLAEEGHAATAAGQLTFLDVEAESSWIMNEAQNLFNRSAQRAIQFNQKVRRAYAKQADLARIKLVEILGEDCGRDLNAWHDLYRRKQEELPVQLLPEGWFPATTDSGSFKTP